MEGDEDMTRAERLDEVRKLTAYTVIESMDVDDLDSIGVILRHNRTGARVSLLINDDENKVFYVGFRTPPTDSTGVAHIVEHTVLCGSDKYPLKDPFVELAKGSLNTFLNAMTYPDKTVYPVASCNDKDFDNLVDVYLDAVFHPNIYHEPRIFKQEGWHYEMEDADSELTINGVVYNEMRGAFSSPDDVVEREILNSLFPDTPYGVESGGDPEVIPDLTYENFLDFHSRYYHPSNSYVYLYGNCDMARKLREIDEEYLSGYDALEVDSAIVGQEPFDSPRYVIREYPIAEDDSVKDKTYLTYSVVVSDNNLDPDEYVAFEVLEYALASTPGSPLKKALIDAGIGMEVHSEIANGTMQPYFSIIATESDPDRLKDFERIIEENLRRLVDEGLKKDTLLAALNLFEFRYREADYGSRPKGLMLGLNMLDSWLYDDSRPFVHVVSNATYARLKAKVETGYFEKLIKDRLLDNPHKAIVTVVPVPGLTGKRDQALAQRLKAYKESLPPDEIDRIVRETHELAEYQETGDTPETMAMLPQLKREDMRKTTEKPIFERCDDDGIETVFHDLFTNGIGYLVLSFRTDKIPTDYWPYLGLLRTVLGMMDTRDYSYSDLYTQISLNTGGIIPTTDCFMDAHDPDRYQITFDIVGKAMNDKLGTCLDLMEQMSIGTRLEDKGRLREIIEEAYSGIKAGMISAGHSVAARNAAAQFSEIDATMEAMSGIPFLRLLERAVGDFDANADELIDRMNRASRLIFRPENLIVDFAGSREALEGIRGNIRKLRDRLCTDEVDAPGAGPVAPTGRTVGYTTAAQVQYVARCGNFRKKGYAHTGALSVLKVILGYDYLWNQVRVRGGAYGCMTRFGRDGKGTFVSYRDPNLQRTVDVFEKTPEYVRNFDADERTMTKYVIGAIAELDVPKTPSQKADFGRAAYMTGRTPEMLQKERDELLGVEPAAIRALAGHVDAIMDTGAYCVVGGEDRIKECADGFDVVEPLFGA